VQALLLHLQAQHQDLLALVQVLEARLAEGGWREHPALLSPHLEALLTALIEHLKVEDGHFYPEALRHPTAEPLARRFLADLVHLQATAAAYREAWSLPASIRANPVGFMDYTEAFLRFLHRRIALEEAELYPALKHGSPLP
jgi:hypothetical protein